MMNPAVERKPRQPNRPWAFWLLFFFQYAAIGAYFSFLNIYFREAGLSGTQIGLINMATAVISVVSAIGWGYVSDRTGKPRLLIAIGAIGSLALNQFMPFVDTFWAFLGLSCLGSLLNTAPSILVDSTAMAWLGERREEYGRYRLGGTIGYILTASVVGFLFDRVGLRFMFPVYGIIMGIFAATALLLPDFAPRIRGKGNREIGEMMRRPAWLLLIVCVFLAWIGTNAAILFTGVVLDSMGATQGLIGIAMTVGAVVEIPFMRFSPNILRRYGPVRLLIVAFGLMVVRFALLAWMPSPEWAIPIGAVNGPTYVLFWNSSVTLANKLAPAGMAGTAQGLLTSTMSLAGVISALLTGVLFDRFGSSGMFLSMAFFALCAFVLFTYGHLKKHWFQENIF